MSFAAMYDDYISRGHQISYELYRQEFEKENIGFGEPSQDACDVCLRQKRHENDVKNADHSPESCDTCIAAAQHVRRANTARDMYRDDMQNDNSYSVDMQKVLILPKLTTKEHLFVSRLVCFNETFASSRRGHIDYAIMWHEGISGRKACDVASAYVKFLVTSEEQAPVLWMDNCSGQNKNWTLYTALVQVVNAAWGPQEVILRYFEAGHTFMAADAVHGLIGQKMKKMPEIITFSELTQIVAKSGRNITPVCMCTDDFHCFVGKTASE